MDEFVKNHPTNSRRTIVNFQLGKLNYRNKKYRQALENFESVDLAELSNSEKAEYYFKSGYCFFKRDNTTEAREYFNKVANTDSKYSSPSAYYLAHMNYADGNFEAALQQFNDLSEDPNFKAVAPYYVVQILFHAAIIMMRF